MLHYSGMYKKERTAIAKNKKYLHNQSYVKVPHKGIFYSAVRSGENITAGQDIGYITDDFGNVLHRITAPASGVVLYKVGTPPVNAGETLFCIGY